MDSEGEELVHLCYLNVAAVRLKTGGFKEVIECCSKAIIH